VAHTYLSDEEHKKLLARVEQLDDPTLIWAMLCLLARDGEHPSFGGRSVLGATTARITFFQVLETWCPKTSTPKLCGDSSTKSGSPRRVRSGIRSSPVILS
jgi:hypothetical protein